MVNIFCMGGSEIKLVLYNCHKMSSVLYKKYSTVVNKLHTTVFNLVYSKQPLDNSCLHISYMDLQSFLLH